MAPLKVFGLGLNKTGTTTLGKCLRQLGFSHVSCRRDLLQRLRAGDLEPIFQVIERYDCFEDWPFPLMYRELLERYGERARYVLTMRSSPQRWLESLKSHSLRTPPEEQCRTLAYGYDYPHGYEREHLALYERHNRDVRAFFRERQAEHILLEVCWEHGDGWQKLCDFVGRPVPNVPFPHANSAADHVVEPEVLAENQIKIARQLASLGVTDPAAYPAQTPLRAATRQRRERGGSASAADFTWGALARRFLPWGGVGIGAAVAALLLVTWMNPATAPKRERGLRFVAKTDIEDLHDALRAFREDTGRVPTSSEGLVALVEAPADLPGWRGPYWDPRRRDVRDPWGNPYVYRIASSKKKSAFEVRSVGPDGVEATPDDVTN